MKFPIPDGALAQHTAVLGKTGSGKTSVAKAAVEHLVVQGARVCVLDPIKSDWWGLTSSADGKKPGLPFQILGGPRGHVPLHPTSGKVIAELVASGALPLCILDMADFPPGGLAQFFNDFAPTLLRKMKGVVHLVMEEAHEFAPKERAGIGNENMLIHHAKKLATAGRSRGIRLILATQRIQALHNALLGSCDTMVALRLTAPADQKPVVDWLKANLDKHKAAEIAASLSKLKTGSGWVCSGDQDAVNLVHFPRIKTYDNSATPEAGAMAAEAVRTAPVDVGKLRELVGAAVAEAEANDPKALKAALATAQTELAKLRMLHAPSNETAKCNVPDQRAMERAITAAREAGAEEIRQRIPDVLDAQHQASFEAGFAFLAARRPVFEPDFIPARGPIHAIGSAITAKLAASTGTSATPSRSQPAAPPRAAAHTARPAPRQSAGTVSLPPGERAVLIAAAQFDGVEREQLSVLTGYKRSSRDAYIQRLREKGFVEVSGSMVNMTDAGANALPADYEPLPTGEGLQAYWLGRLPEGERRILQVLIDNYPGAVERTVLDETTGYKRSSRDAYLQRMKAKRLWDAQGSSVRASEALFT